MVEILWLILGICVGTILGIIVAILRVKYLKKRDVMRSEVEIKEFLKLCRASSDYGLSKGPCPLLINETKDCTKYCTYNDPCPESIPKEEWEKMRKDCCEDWDKHEGCCAECSYPSALEWVLNERITEDAGANGQKRLINDIKVMGSTKEIK